MRHFMLILALLASQPIAGWSLDGFSVTTHSAFGEDGGNGLFGEIRRHDIAGGKVAPPSTIFPGPARKPAISPDGTFVAFIKRDGMIAVVPAAGGPAKDLVLGHPGGHLDVIDGGWIYYNLGGVEDAGSVKLRRVNAATGKDEKVVDFQVEGGDKIWRFGVSRDGKRMEVDRAGGVRVWTYDLARNDGKLTGANALQGVTAYPDNGESCGGSMSASGAYFGAGHDSHMAYHILDWATRKEVFSFAYGPVEGLPLAAWFPTANGNFHERNAWSVNSDDWLLLHVLGGAGKGEHSCGNQVLVNWAKKTALAATANAIGSGRDDCAGDLWISATAPAKSK